MQPVVKFHYISPTIENPSECKQLPVFMRSLMGKPLTTCYSSATTISAQNLSEEDDDPGERIENHTVEPEWYDAGCNPSVDFTVFDSEEPCATNADGEDQTRNRLIHVTTSAVTGTEPETISNSMNTSETMTTTEGVFMNVLTRTATVARSVLEFTGALSTLLGTQTERFSDEDPRIIPFVYIQSGDRQQFYIDGPVNSESGFRSSTIGSEISSISDSEPSQTQTRSRRVGQDRIPPQLFDMSWIMASRKPLFPLDDEPSIY